MEEQTALSHVARVLADAVTNTVIGEVAAGVGVRKLFGTNKIDKIRWLLGPLLSDGRSRSTAGTAILTMVVEAIHRTHAGKAEHPLTVEQLDAIIAALKVLRLPAGDLTKAQCRVGLPSAGAKATPTPSVHPPSAPPPTVHSGLPRRHDRALSYMAELLKWEPSRAQQRGREFEKVLHEVLKVERLNPEHNIVNPGEQIDLSFALTDGHYLIECRWEHGPQGLPAVRDLSEKVRRKAEGTFGVLVSMTDFASNINDTASVGSRLNCIGIGHAAVLHVLEGRKTFETVVRSARTAASTRAVFFAGE